MDDCPHCGEPIEEDAESCPHCGSDFETGWKPDADDYALDLPDDDPIVPEDAPARPRGAPALEVALSASLLLAAAVLFVALHVYVGGQGWGVVLPFVLLLAACVAWTLRRPARGERTSAR
ncbi:MAG: zinc-ribbon domain-containing protein [Planctomycetes bacterium]|nr:zinc-ribbon domain-containing protein [Planctomycetota bacterium]